MFICYVPIDSTNIIIIKYKEKVRIRKMYIQKGNKLKFNNNSYKKIITKKKKQLK